MVGIVILPDEKKHQDDESRSKSFRNHRKRIYLVNSIFEAWEDVKIEVRYKRCSDTGLAAIFCL